MISCVVFDFDGTLVDSNTIKKQAFIAIAREYDGSSEMESILCAKDTGNRTDVFKKFIDSKFDKNNLQDGFLEKLVENYTLNCRSAIGECSDVHGAITCLNFLNQKRLLVCINSATPANPLIDIIKDRGWVGKFDLILGAPKSKVENLAYIANKFNLNAQEILMVGDMSVDLEAAIKFGSKFAGILSKESDLEGLCNTLFKDQLELKNFLLDLLT